VTVVLAFGVGRRRAAVPGRLRPDEEVAPEVPTSFATKAVAGRGPRRTTSAWSNMNEEKKK